MSDPAVPPPRLCPYTVIMVAVAAWGLGHCWRYRELPEALLFAWIFGGIIVVVVGFAAWEWLGERAVDRAITRWDETGDTPKGYR